MQLKRASNDVELNRLNKIRDTTEQMYYLVYYLDRLHEVIEAISALHSDEINKAPYSYYLQDIKKLAATNGVFNKARNGLAIAVKELINEIDVYSSYIEFLDSKHKD